MIKNEILGSWSLVAFELENPEGLRKPWGEDLKGLLIYSADGHMSVGINKSIPLEAEENSEEILDSILFYSGTYCLAGQIIRHRVQVATDPKRIGQEMIRSFRYENGLLELTSPSQSFGRSILTWRKASP